MMNFIETALGIVILLGLAMAEHSFNKVLANKMENQEVQLRNITSAYLKKWNMK